MIQSETTIEVESLVKRFGRVAAVSNISFTVGRGEIIGFLGPNGAGKSTTMRILSGYLPATSGIARVCGYSVAGSPAEIKRRIGYMPENNPLPEDLRVRDYLHWRGQLKELGWRRRKQRVESVLDLCDLERAQSRIIGKLSKGFKQRVGVADAILAEPDVVIMDEPTIGLDPHQIITMRDLIGSLRGRHSVIISSHILPEIEMTCDRVIIINNGHIVASGTPDKLRREFVDRTTYDLEVKGEFSAIEAALDRVDPKRKLERPVEMADKDGFHKLMVHMKADRHRGEDILQALNATEGIRVRALTCRQATLEEVFLAATRRSWETVTPLSNPIPPKPTTPVKSTADGN